MNKTIEDKLLEQVYSALQKIGNPRLVLPVCMIISAYQAWVDGTSFEDYIEAIKDISKIFWDKNIKVNLEN